MNHVYLPSLRANRTQPYHLLKFKLAGLCVLTVLMLAPHASWATNQKQATPTAQANSSNLDRIKQKIQVLAESLSIAKNAHDSATEALKASEIKISESRKKLRELQQAQRLNKQSLNQLSKSLLKAQQSVDLQRRKIAEQLRGQYLQGRADHLQLLLQQQDPNRIARDMQYLGYISQARRNEIAKLQSSLTEIERIQAENAEELKKTSKLTSQYAETTKQLEQEKNQKAQVVSKLSKKIESQEQQLQRLKRDEQTLAQLMKRLSDQSAKRQQAQAKLDKQNRDKQSRKKQTFDKQKSGSRSTDKTINSSSESQDADSDITDSDVNTSAPAKSIATNDMTPEYAEANISFSQLRGLLRLPVRGQVTNRFGSARADTGVTWKGIFIRASEGNEVKSVAKGRVVFSDWMRGFGNLIIIDHGHGYMSLYGNNESLYKNTGQGVNAGDTIASVGNSGGNQESGVYYELRRNSMPFDPLSWSRLR